MKKINKFIIAVSSTMPILLSSTAISCKNEEQKMIKENQKQIEAKLSEIEKLQAKLKTDKLENEISTKLLNDLKAKAKSDKVFKSADEKIFKSIMSELDNIPKIAEKIASEFKKLTNEKEKILERNNSIKSADFSNLKEYLASKIDEKIKEAIKEYNTLLKGLEKENKSNGDFEKLLNEIPNKIDEEKYFTINNDLITKLLSLQNKYSKKEKADNLLQGEEKKNFLNDIIEIKNYISNIDKKTSEAEVIQKVQNYINKFDSYYAKLTKFIQFSNVAQLFEKLEKVIDEKEGLLNNELLKELFTNDNLITNVKKEINDFIQKCGKFLKKEFSEEITIKTKEVAEILTDAAKLFAKYFKEILNKVKDEILKKVTENDTKLAVEQYEKGDKFLDLFDKDGKYYLGKENYRLFDFKDTILAKYYEIVKDILQISRLTVKTGEKIVSSGAEIFSNNENKFIFSFKLINKLLSTNEHTTDIHDTNISLDITKK